MQRASPEGNGFKTPSRTTALLLPLNGYTIVYPTGPHRMTYNQSYSTNEKQTLFRSAVFYYVLENTLSRPRLTRQWLAQEHTPALSLFPGCRGTPHLSRALAFHFNHRPFL